MYRKEHYLIGGLTFLFVLVCYLLTMAPSMTFWDAGEFIAASYTLGIPHPPGTPLFVNIGRVISVLPLPFSVAERLNFLSVLCGSLSALMFYLIAVKILETWIPRTRTLADRIVIHGGAVAAALIPPFLFSVWPNCTETEVYAVASTTIVFVAWLMVYMGSLQDRKRIRNVLLLVVYIVSLSIGNHLIVLLVAPAVVVFTLLHDRDNRAYWLSVLGCYLGLYLLVLKGLDMPAVAARLSQGPSGESSLVSSLFQVSAGSLDVLFSLYRFVASWPLFLIGFLVTCASLFLAYREKALSFFGASLGLFLLGYSIHLYLLIRSGLNPPLNEGQPDSLQTLWAVIRRDQYGSAYGLLPRLVWSMITGKASVASIADLIGNIKVFFQYNIPFYTTYFGWQYGNWVLSLVFFLFGAWGAFEHWRHARNSFYFWLTVFLLTGMILNIYMNFKLGYTQANGAYPDQSLHEVRERDYFFMISFAFFGLWSGLGLAAAVNRLRLALKMDSPGPRLGQAGFAALALTVLAASLTPLIANYRKADRSGNLIPRQYALNMMNSLEPNGIIFTNGDNDTFPLWYIREVEGVRKDCRVVNLSLLNLPWYIRQMRDQEPKVPISYTDEALGKMFRFRLPKDGEFKMDGIDIVYPKGSIVEVKDLILLDILRGNKWNKPLYFTTTTASQNFVGLEPYLTMFGSTYKINPRKSADAAAVDSNIVATGYPNLFMDLSATRRLCYDVYNYDAFQNVHGFRDEEDRRMTQVFAAPLNLLGNGLIQRRNYPDAIEAKLRARDLLLGIDGWDAQSDYALSALYAENHQYRESLARLDSTQVTNFTWYSQVAQIAANRGERNEAAMFLEHAVKRNPNYRDGYAHLFLLQNSAGNRDAAAEAIERYLRLNPNDKPVAEELRKYRAGGDFDMTRSFGMQVK
jgi:hypothetical protein